MAYSWPYNWQGKIAQIEAVLPGTNKTDRQIGNALRSDLREGGFLYDYWFVTKNITKGQSSLLESDRHARWRVDRASQLHELNQIAARAEAGVSLPSMSTDPRGRLVRALGLQLSAGMRHLVTVALEKVHVLGEPGYYGAFYHTNKGGSPKYPTLGKIESSLVNAMAATDEWLPISGYAP